jgi:predicted nucleotidyltransferase
MLRRSRAGERLSVRLNGGVHVRRAGIFAEKADGRVWAARVSGGRQFEFLLKLDYLCVMEKISDYIGQRGGVSKRAYGSLLSFRRKVEEAFPDYVEDVVLFGSRARSEANGKSDYDVAVLLSGNGSGSDADRRLSRLAYPYMLEGVFISPISLPADIVSLAQESLLAHSIVHEGLVIS